MGIPASHWAAAGGTVGAPVRLVPSITHGKQILVPADAEIVIEGFIPPDRFEAEGPFAEYPGTQGPQIANPVIEVTCITRRPDAIYHDCASGLADALVPDNMAMEGVVHAMTKPVSPTLENVHVPSSGRRFHAYLQFRDPRPGEVGDIASVPATNVVITDDLDVPVSGQLSYVAASATMNGTSAGVSVLGSVITANYWASSGPLQPGASVVLRFRAVIDSGLAMGTTITNTGMTRWNSPPQTASASVSVDLGGMPGVGVAERQRSGTTPTSTESVGRRRARVGSKAGAVELYRNGQLVHTVLSDAGRHLPDRRTRAQRFERRPVRAPLPRAGRRCEHRLARAGRALPIRTARRRSPTSWWLRAAISRTLNLPIEPNGVVYDSVERSADRRCDASPARGQRRHGPARGAASMIPRSRARSPSPTATTSSI